MSHADSKTTLRKAPGSVKRSIHSAKIPRPESSYKSRSKKNEPIVKQIIKKLMFSPFSHILVREERMESRFQKAIIKY